MDIDITMTPQKPIIQELNENISIGFTKSVNALYNAVITYIKRITKTGARVCQYNHTWHETGYLMSPVHIGFDGSAMNTVLQPDNDLQKLLDTVQQKLISEQIKVGRCEAKYITPNNINYLIRFVIDLEVFLELEDKILENLDQKKKSPEPPEIDFKCASC